MNNNEAVNIDLTKPDELNEGFLKMLGNAISTILKAMFGGYSIPVNVKGSRDQINAFAKTLDSEKQYIETYRSMGLDNPSTYRSRYQLNKAVQEFERKTGLIWPFR